MIEIVFFDAGETILHPYPSFPELFAQTCKEHGASIEAEHVEDLQTQFGRHLLHVAAESGIENPSLSRQDSFQFWTHLYRRILRELGLDEEIAPKLYGVFSDSRSYKLFDDVQPTFARLEGDGYRLGLISNFEGWLEKMLVELEVGHAFDVSVISGIEGVEKPDPRIYEMALEKAGVSGTRAVHVGDSTKYDVVPARTAGMHAVLIDRSARGVGPDGGLDDGWPTISSLEELPKLLAKL